METPHDPKYDKISEDVEEMYTRQDLAYYAFMNMVLDTTHEE